MAGNKKALRQAYGEALAELGGVNTKVVVLDADVASSSKSILFGEKYPERFFNVGISEANMAGMAAGFATAGKIPFINTFAAFMVLRAGDPIRSLIAYTGLNVKIAGTYAGLSDSYDGATHHSLLDLAFMRALPNLTVLSPADPVETAAAVRAAAEHYGPVYLRLSRAEVPYLFSEPHDFVIGKGTTVTDGSDLTIAATGYMVYKAKEAAELLAGEGVSVRVLDMSTIKPLDSELLLKAARETGAVLTVEEHSIYGGLGGAVAELLGKEHPVPLDIVGINDSFAESGDYESLLDKYGLSTEKIAERARALLKRKKSVPAYSK